jgi:diguanylate cyclase (GGDEF)-like protein
MRILLVEDDDSLADLVKKTLIERQNCVVDATHDGDAGLDLAKAFEYDLILLDLILPKLDGISFCQRLRSKGDRTPILLLTAKDEISNKVKGLDAGADDYLVKPFDLEELLARIGTLMRRGQDSQLPSMDWGNLHLNPNNCEVKYGEQQLKLTAKEYALLELFLRNPHRIFSQNIIIDRLWSLEESPSIHAVRTQIKGLRQKLKAVGANFDPIETIYGLGYKLRKETDSYEQDPKKNSQVLNSSLITPNPALQKIWQKHQASYLEKIQLLEQYITQLQQDEKNCDLKQEAIAQAHTLAGSLGSFGWQEVSTQFRHVERNLNSWGRLNQLERENLVTLISSLERQLQEVSSSQMDSETKAIDSNSLPNFYIESKKPLENKQSAPKYQILERKAKLLIVDDDLALAEALEIEAQAWGLEVAIAHNLSQAREIIEQNQPNVILLDLSFPSSKENGFELLQELNHLNSEIPVIVFTAKESFADRVKVARLGGKGFLQKPVSAADAIEAISQVLQKSSLPEARVLVVDDDPETLDSIRNFLEPWGCELTLLEHPHQFWETLESTNPDLLILDVEMPFLSGIELCQVVRNDPRWQEIPILSLSAHQDSQTIQTVFTVGADDYIKKPIVGAELVARVLNRLDRERYRRQVAEIDALTGVSNRRKSIKQLTRMLNLAKRQNQPFCFMILDLDYFKKINDIYGHEAGDLVLRHLGKLLNRTFRGEDVIARWGGEEFAIGLYNMTKSAGIERLQKLLHSFRQREFTNVNNRAFKVTFSAGVAQYSKDGEDLQTLYQAADIALYQAKTKGRNQVVGFEETGV